MATTELTAEALTPVIKAIIEAANETDQDISLKQVRRQIEERLGLEANQLDSQKDLVKEIVTKVVDEQEEADEEEVDASQPSKRAADGEGSPSKRAKGPEKKPSKGVGKAQSNAMTQEQFMKEAKPLKICFNDGEALMAAPRIFSTGSAGWNLTGKQLLKIGDGDTTLMAQIGLNVTFIGSKQWSEK
jgi:hypothetical protein